MPDIYYKHPVTGKMVPENEIPADKLESVKRKGNARRKKIDDAFVEHIHNIYGDVKETYKKQKSKVDKLSLVMQFSTCLDVLPTEVDRLDPDVLEANKMPGTKNFDLVEPGMKNPGEEITDNYFKEEFDNNNLEELKKFYEAIAVFHAKQYIESGKNYKYVYKNKTVSGEHDRELKARYLTLNGGFGAGFEYNEYTGLIFDGYGGVLTGNGISKTIWTMVDFDKDKTTISDLLKLAGATKNQRDKFLGKLGTTEDANAYEAFADYYIRVFTPRGALYDNAEYANPATRQAYLEKNPDKVKFHEEITRLKETEKDSVMETLMAEFGTLVRRSWIDNIHDTVRKNLSDEDAKLYDIGKDICTGEKSNIDNKFSKEEIIEIKNTAYELCAENVVKANNNIQKAVTSKKSLRTRTIPGISETFNDEAAPLFNPEDEMALKNYIAVLEATGNGSGMFHQSNSQSYERMLGSIKAYHKAIAEKSGGKALEYKEEMIDNLKAYIKGKKSIRHSEFGRTRFDAVMGLLSRFVDGEEYAPIINRINDVRKSWDKTPEKGYVTAAQYENAYKTARIKEMKVRAEAYEKTKTDALNLSPAVKKTIVKRVETQFGEIPSCAPIGYAPDNGHLSHKDFSAIAYIACKSEPDGEPSAEFGKEKTIYVMENYKKGNKRPLAKLLVRGIGYLKDKVVKAPGLNSELLLHGELLCRIARMFDRDAELRKHAVLCGLDKDYMKVVSAVRNLTEVKNNAAKAITKQSGKPRRRNSADDIVKHSRRV